MALGSAKEDWRKTPAAEMSPVELRVVGQGREGEEQLHGAEEEVCIRDAQPVLPSDQWERGEIFYHHHCVG